MGYQSGNHDKGRLRLGQDGRRAQHVPVREAHGEAQVLGPAVVERGHDPPGDLAVALVEEGPAALQHRRRGRRAHVAAPARGGGAVRLVEQAGGDDALELLQRVDGLVRVADGGSASAAGLGR